MLKHVPCWKACALSLVLALSSLSLAVPGAAADGGSSFKAYRLPLFGLTLCFTSPCHGGRCCLITEPMF